MVREKVPSKLVIQADHVKSEKRLGSLKPSSCQNQDGRSRGPDMKKKMRRSRSIKLSDMESLKSPAPPRKAMSQSGKPPPVSGTTAAATPQKQFIVKTADGSPNYMKSTSSSEARKERSQVNTQTGSNGRNQHCRNSGGSKFSPASGDRPARTLSKTSSLKLARTPTFKPARGTAKKRSRAALFADGGTQKATCSSTLKDSKFPAYLKLNPGGSEAEGTSVKKVCPHAYCSLNGHHHKPVPQLKGFLKARRRIKLEVLSPRRTRPSGDGTEETRGLLDFSGDKPVIQEVEKGFFIEIGAVKTEDGAYETEKRTENEGETACALLGEPEGEINESCFYAGHEAAAEQDSNNHVSESLSDESQESEIDCKENVNDNNAAEMDVAVGFVIEDEKDGDTDCSSSFSEKESNRSDIERESHSSTEEDDNISEATNMDWEEGQPLTSDIDAEADDLNKQEDKFWTKVEFTAEIEKLDWREDSEIIMSDDAVSNYTEEIPADEVLRELFAEETASSDMQCSDRDSESDIIPHYRQILESNRVAGDLAYEQPSAAEDAFEAPRTEEKDKEAERDLRDAVNTSASIRESVVELIGAREKIQENNETDKSLGDGENGCAAHISAEALKGHQEDKSLQAESAATKPQVYEKRDKIGTNKEDEIDQIILVAENNQELAVAEIPDSEAGDATEAQEQVVNAELPFEIHVSDSPESFSVADQNDAELNADGNHMTTKVCQLNATYEKDSSSQDLVDDSTPTEPHDHQLDEQIVNSSFPFEIHVSYSTESFSIADQDDAELNADGNHMTTEVCQLNATYEKNSSSQDLVDASTPTEPHDHQLDEQDETNNVLENENLFEEDQYEVKKIKILTAIDFEAPSSPRTHEINSNRDDTGDVEETEVEVCNESGTAETFLSANNGGTCTGSKCSFVFTSGNPNPELQCTCNDRKWTIGERKPIKDLEEEEREFNPREPNFLPAVPNPEAEKVDLRHQMMDGRKNSEEWMLDYALQQAVTKLAPARKRKVALLVEAFENVLPTPKYETHIRHTPATFSPATNSIL